MRTRALPLMALALIVAIPIVAQTSSDQNPKTPLQQQPVQEKRTNPDAPAITGDSGLTITGTVVSFTDTALVLQTTAGTHTIQFDNRTTKPATLNVGDRVTVDYTRNSTGVMIAAQVRSEGLTTTGTTVGETDLRDDDDLATTGSAELDQERDLADTTGDELPETGSELPLIGLIGFLALLAASGFRASRRNV